MSEEIFEKLKNNLLNLDPVSFCERYLTLDGKPFRLTGNGYKPFGEVYRYIGVKALEKTSKPLIIVKGRQVGATTMASALEMYFMGCGLFGVGTKPAIRIIHAFPQLSLAAAYSKTKLNSIISSSVILDEERPGVKAKSYMQKLLDQTTATSDSLQYKQFSGGNHIWIESVGADGERVMGRTADVLFFDECMPGDQKIKTEKGNIKLIKLVNNFLNNKENPKVLSFNEESGKFEYCEITNAWIRGPKKIIEFNTKNKKVKCTPNHKFLTESGWREVKDINVGEKIAFMENCLEYHEILSFNEVEDKVNVYDIEVEKNHNFILDNNIIAHNCQSTAGLAIGNSLKVLTTAKYGRPSKGVQIFFGTPRGKGSDFHKMWQTSSQQYYYLGCAKCDQHFPLYTPGSDDWKKVWIHGHIVKCTHCGHEQNKLEAAERGKWVAYRDPNDPDCLMVGFHLNQLYMPMFTREDMDAELPGRHPINTEKVYMNEVLGEFFQGDSSPITPEDIREKCADTRRFASKIQPAQDKNQIIVLGLDYGQRNDVEKLTNPSKGRVGQSYSTAVVLSAQGPHILHIEFAGKFPKNDLESKKSMIDQLMRKYSVDLAVGDIGYSNDLSEILHNIYGDKYLVSRAQGKSLNRVTFKKDFYPKEIGFDRNFYIGEFIEKLKKGEIKFPFGSYEEVAWLIEHCCSMEIKPSVSKNGGDPELQYVKGSTPNDGFMAMLNAYLAYKFIVTNGFTTNNPFVMQNNITSKAKPMILGGYISRRM